MPSRDLGRASGAVASSGGDQPPRKRPGGPFRITPHDVWVFMIGGFCLALLAGLIAALVLLLS